MLKKDLQVEEIYEAVRNLTGNDLFLVNLCLFISSQRSEYLEPIQEEKCFKENPPATNSRTSPTAYDNNAFEYFMWMNSLVSLCWLLSNVKHKTLDGHCHNPIHDEIKKENGHPRCKEGSEFHSKFYDNVVDSLERLLKHGRANRPKIIGSE